MAQIQLPYNQLLQWVIARGKTPEDCNKRLIAMEELCKGFFDKYPSMPENVKELRKHVHSEYTEWYEVLCDITEKLKTTEEGGKVNFLGQYSYQPLYDADKIQRMFHKHNLHIVSYCQALQKQMEYNLPSIKKSMEALNKELNDYKGRRTESIRKLNANSTELQNRLQTYRIDIKEYPFKEDFRVCLKVRLIEEIADKNAEIIIQNYKRAAQSIQTIHKDVVPVFKAFVDFQKLNKLFDEDDIMKNIRHAAERGLESTTEETNPQDTQTDESSDKSGNESTNHDAIIKIVRDDDDVPIAEDKRRIVFCTNLGNSSFRQLVLMELLQLRVFLKVRVDELQNRSDAASYIFNQTGENIDKLVMQPISKYEKYLEITNHTIELLSGTEAMKALSILKNKSDREKSAQKEIDIWNRCCNEVAEQAILAKRIEATTESLQKLAAEFDSVKATIRDIKVKLEKTATEVMETPVKVFGEIDNI